MAMKKQQDAETFVKNKIGNSGYPDLTEFSTVKEAQDAVYDVLSESNIGELYPEKVWSKVSDDLIKKLWLMHKKKGGDAALRPRAFRAGDTAQAKQGQRR